MQGSTPYYYHPDQLGSIRALTDGSGTVQNTYTYDAYGSTTSSTGTVSNPFRYAEEYLDSESGFYYLRARYYDPSTQQFLTRDPLLSITGQGYNYANGNPTNWTDPSGLRHSVGLLGDGDAGGGGGDFVIPIAIGLWSLAVAAASQASQWVQHAAAIQFPSLCGPAQADNQVNTVGWKDLPWRRKRAPKSIPETKDTPEKVFYDPPGEHTTEKDAWSPEHGGYRDSRGWIWKPAPPGQEHGGPHWDVQLPNGRHINVRPDGTVINSVANPYPLPPHP